MYAMPSRLELCHLNLEEKATPVGNACLGGAAKFLQAPGRAQADMDMLFSKVQEIILATLPRFSKYFVDYMLF